MRLVGIIVILAIIAGGGYVYWDFMQTPVTKVAAPLEENKEEENTVQKKPLSEGTFVVDTKKSTLTWSGKKPLISGYINTGTISIESGFVQVKEESGVARILIDMSTLSVSETKKKPGEESLLEEDLKGEDWFNVEEFPTATFAIESISATEKEHAYSVAGALTMKGQTQGLTFPAEIYMDSNGNVIAKANFEFDRTKWGITTASGSLFDNLADNVIDDMVAMSFSIVAIPGEAEEAEVTDVAEEVAATSTTEE